MVPHPLSRPHLLRRRRMASQQAQQAVLANAMEVQLPDVWAAYMQVHDLAASLPDYINGIKALVHRYGIASASIAARYYAKERAAQGIAGKVTVTPASPDLEGLDVGIRWATKGLWSEEPDVPAAQSLVRGVAERQALDTGRNTLLDAIHADKKAKGWARVIEPGACSFCILLATRGAVYREHSFTTSNFKFSGPGAFKAHNHCRCSLEPVFGEYEPSADLRKWQALYQETSKGKSGRAARSAFREAVDATRQ